MSQNYTMRIGFILDGNFRNDSRVINEARILESKGNQVYVLNPRNPGTSHIDLFSSNITILHLPFSKKIVNYLFAIENLIPLYDYIWSTGIIKLVRDNKIESLHLHDLYLARAGRMAARKLNIPIVLDLHENYPAAVMQYKWATRFPARLIVRPGRWKVKEKKYLSYASSIIVLSNSFKNDLLIKYNFLKPGAIFIYPNVPDIHQFDSFKIDSSVFPKENRFILCYFGVISERRGIRTAIEALKKLINESPQLHLLLIGPIDKAERECFEALFSEPEIKEHITHYPWKDISELPSFLACSDICLSPLVRNPQHDSGVANKIFQYMLFKKPLLVSDCIPQKEIIEDVKCGRFYINCNSDDMASVIKEMMDSPDELIQMGERGNLAVQSVYNTAVQGINILRAHSLTRSETDQYDLQLTSRDFKTSMNKRV